MTPRSLISVRLAPLAAALALAGCGFGKDGNALADANDADPALTSALNDQILVDPNLANQSNKTAIRPSAQPPQAPYPVPPAEKDDPTAAQPVSYPASAAAAAGSGKGCADPARFHYDNRWASRLSPDFPIYPGAQVVEAAANDTPDCRTRAVTFRTGEGWQRVLDWYHTRAVRGGYSSEHQIRQGDHVLAGVNGRDGGVFYLIVTPRDDHTQVALIANKGR
jgi:hypothetical protein